MPVPRIKEFLDAHKVRYECIPHFPSFTAQGTAAVSHTPGRDFAKCVVVNADDDIVLAVLCATCQLDLGKMRQVTGAQAVVLATEREMARTFYDCAVGAMPPFGNLYHVQVYMDQALASREYITFNGGNHNELIRMATKDFRKLVSPVVIGISQTPHYAAAG